MAGSLIRNERLKLAAGALNTIGVATIVTAVVVPAVSLSYGNLAFANIWYRLAGAWLMGGLAPHIAAQIMLGRLTRD